MARVIAAQRGMDEPEPRQSRNLAILLFLTYTGVRNFELCRLKVSDVDLQERSAFIRSGKGDKDRAVHYTQEVADAVRAYWKARGWHDRMDPAFARHDKGAGKKHKHLSTTMIREIVDAAEEAAGLEGIITPHKFRHHFATDLLNRTRDLALVQDALGHSSPETTRVYAQVSNEERKERYHEAFGE
jgi:integrase